MNSALNDALKLCEFIRDGLSLRDKWVVVNIAIPDKIEKRTFISVHYPRIPTSYGYFYDKVPQILIEEGVIEAKVKGLWFINTYINFTTSTENYDYITLIARKKGYFKSKQSANYFYGKPEKMGPYSKLSTDKGPKTRGQYAVLINVEALKLFIGWYSNQIPLFDIKSGDLTYLNQTINFNGPLKRATVKILVDNINSIVKKETLYNIRGEELFVRKQRTKKLTVANEATKKMIKEIVDKIKEHKTLREYLVLATWNGYGLFVNKYKNEQNPQ